jgi:hypothetical protein
MTIGIEGVGDGWIVAVGLLVYVGGRGVVAVSVTVLQAFNTKEMIIHNMKKGNVILAASF